MGISKSLKRIFGKKKKDFVSSDITSDTSLKSPKNTRKGGTSQVIRKVQIIKHIIFRIKHRNTRILKCFGR